MDSDVVILWRAPSVFSRYPEREVVDGFSPSDYPGNGPYFATDLRIALDWAYHYRRGLQQIHLDRTLFDRLVNEGILAPDGYYGQGQSWHVPNEKLDRFNLA